MAADEDETPKTATDAEGAKRRRRAGSQVTIDLEAKLVEPKDGPAAGSMEEVARREETAGPKPETESPTPEPDTVRAPPTADRDRGRAAVSVGFVGLMATGLVGGLIVLLIGFALQAGGLVPAPGSDAADAALAEANALKDAVAALDKRVGTVETAAKATSADRGEIAAKIVALESAAGAIEARLDRLEATPARATPPATGAGASDAARVLDDLLARVDHLESVAATSTADAGALAELRNRIAAVEATARQLLDRVAALAARPPEAAQSEKAARAIAIGTLRQAAARGGGFAADLAMLDALGFDPEDLAALKPLAAKNVQSRAQLAADFPAVADTILAATATVDQNAGFFDRLMARARGLVSIRPIAPIAGNTPEAIVSRMTAAVGAGDLEKARAERDSLPAPAKIVSAVWADAAADRVAVDKLVDRLALKPAPAANN
jgi:hypothetical protein